MYVEVRRAVRDVFTGSSYLFVAVAVGTAVVAVATFDPTSVATYLTARRRYFWKEERRANALMQPPKWAAWGGWRPVFWANWLVSGWPHYWQ